MKRSFFGCVSLLCTSTALAAQIQTSPAQTPTNPSGQPPGMIQTGTTTVPTTPAPTPQPPCDPTIGTSSLSSVVFAAGQISPTTSASSSSSLAPVSSSLMSSSLSGSSLSGSASGSPSALDASSISS